MIFRNKKSKERYFMTEHNETLTYVKVKQDTLINREAILEEICHTMTCRNHEVFT